jgi:N-methylhydantoinase B/oxoprolinase/acetone carboxylase alpha subunit
MAALVPPQFIKVWSDGLSDKASLYALRNVVTGDTLDTAGDFTIVKQAIMIGTTVNGSATAAVSGTVVTMPAGLNHDAAYLLVWGASA